VARIFAATGFKASDLPADLYHYLQRLPNDFYVLLEFISPGPRARQVDCAIVGPLGVDVVELKRHQGAITTDPNRPWPVVYKGKTTYIVNTRNGVEENPYQQAENTSDDLKGWVHKTIDNKVRFAATVLVAKRNPATVHERHNYVSFANGVDELPAQLRNLRPYAQGVLEPSVRDLIVERLHLSEVGLSLFRGIVQNGASGQPLSGIRVAVDGIPEELLTDRNGEFSFVFKHGEEARVRILPPDGYHKHEVVEMMTLSEHHHTYPLQPKTAPNGGQDANVQPVLDALKSVTSELAAKVASIEAGINADSNHEVADLRRRLEVSQAHVAALELRGPDGVRPTSWTG
jgi:hypothetical protein